MDSKNEQSGTVRTADTMFDIIEVIQRLDGAGVTETADEIGMAKSTVHKHLKTLHKKKYLIKQGQEYHLTLKFLDHGMYALQELEVMDVIQPSLDRLAEKTQEAVWFLVEEHGKGVPCAKALHEQSIETIERIGMRTHLHIHAAGKAILAYLPQERAERIIDRYGLPARTAATITSQDELFDELEVIRDRGYAFMDSEAVPDIRSVAAPIITDGTVHGSITVVGPARRLQGELFRDEIPNAVLAATNAIELDLVYN